MNLRPLHGRVIETILDKRFATSHSVQLETEDFKVVQPVTTGQYKNKYVAYECESSME